MVTTIDYTDDKSSLAAGHVKKPYNHPLSKNINNNKVITKHEKLQSTIPIHINDEIVSTKDAKELDPLRNYRSNSHNNLKIPSHSSSLLESANTSFKQDGNITGDMGYNQKTSRIIKNVPDHEIESSRGEIINNNNTDFTLNERLNNVQNSFAWVRSKVSSSSQSKLINTDKENENILIRLNLNKNNININNINTAGSNPNYLNNNYGDSAIKNERVNYPFSKTKSFGSSAIKYTSVNSHNSNNMKGANMNDHAIKSNYEYAGSTITRKKSKNNL